MPIEARPESTKSQGRGRSNSLPACVVDYLKAWLMSPEHINHPYPTEQEKAQMVADTGIELKRLNNWFVNNRIRYWKPRMEELQRQKRDEEKPEVAGNDAKNAPTTKASNLHPVSSINSLTDLQIQELSCLSTEEAEEEEMLSSSCSLFIGIVSDASTSSTDGSEDGTLSDVLSAIKTIQVRQIKSPPKRKSRNPLKRKREEYAVVESSPRTKYSSKNIKLWRNACESSVHDDSLPSLDEAACLFGFSIDQ